jgi:hypothetical protein
VPEADAPMSERVLLDCGVVPASDRWTIALWGATAELLFCRYHYREEGAYDGAGRWRRRHVRHCLAGRPANLARATAMAEHFCSVVRQCAKAYARERARSGHARRSFESAFAERLVARLKAALAEARRNAEADLSYATEFVAGDALLRKAGIDRANRAGRYDMSGRDRGAARQARAAADNLSLVLRTAVPARASAARRLDQLALPF